LKNEWFSAILAVFKAVCKKNRKIQKIKMKIKDEKIRENKSMTEETRGFTILF
jgi:hypothetical protein